MCSHKMAMLGLMMRDDGLIRASLLSPCLFLARSPFVLTLPKTQAEAEADVENVKEE